MDPSERKQLESREYQVELFELAVEKNIILYLPTGSGKTFIATLLIKHFCNLDNDKIYLPIACGGVRTFFLVNTVALVSQQAGQISSQTTLCVGRYSGDIGVDLWDNDVWQNELNTHQILVMTSQIFVDLMAKNRISLQNVNLLIFDECHRAVSNHPMRQAMQLFEKVPPNKQPRVLGLTATLLNGNVKPNNVKEQIRQLEITFMAEIQTSLDEEMVKLYSTNPVESRVTHDDNDCKHICYRFCDSRLTKLKDLLNVVQIEDSVDPPPGSRPKESYQINSNSKKTNKRLKNVADDITSHLQIMGIYGGSLAVLAHLVQVQQMLPNIQHEVARLIFQSVSAEFVSLRKFFEDEMEKSGGSDLDKLTKFSSDKVKKLFSILKKVKSADSAIVFVQRRFSAKILYYLVNKASKVDPKLAHIKCNFVVGYNVGDPFKDTRENYLQRKQNTKVMNMFNQGELNVLFASNVVEEGVDISKCNYVIMFDPIQDFRGYVQSKGRARDRESQFIVMVSKNDTSFINKYLLFHETEDTLKGILYGGKSRLRSAPTLQEVEVNLFATTPGLEPYMPSGQNGPVITALTAVATLNRYFGSLRVDKFTRVNHFWFISKENSKFRCFLQLPMEARNPTLVKGTLQSTVDNAQRSAAMEACKILHASGDLGDNDLLPVSADAIVSTSNFTPNIDGNEVFEELVDGKPVKVGTKKNKRTCEKKWADSLSECTPQPDQEVYLHLIEVTPKYTAPVDNHRLWMVHHFLSLPNHFGILSSKKLPKIAPFPLYLSVGELEATIHSGEKVKLSAEELKQISGFHFTIFDSVLTLAKQFMVRDLTNKQNAYFIAPVVKDKTVKIDWDVIRESNKTFPSPNNKPTTEDRQSLQVTNENYFGRIVTPWYRTVPAQKYIVTEVCEDMSEETQFPTDNYENYKEYFKEKYKIEPLLKGQPLLEVRALSSGLNSIKPRASTKQHKRKNKDENEEFEVFLLPEFCIVFPFPGRYWLKAQLLPSALHRVSQLCLAEELRCTIALETGIGASNHFLEWLKLKEDVSLKKDKDADQDKTQALKPLTLSNNQSSTLINMPDIWGSEEEPVDIERNMETASLFDIFSYEAFNKKSLKKSVADNGLNTSLSDTPGSIKVYEMKMVNPPPLAVLSKDCNEGPQQVEVLQALTAAASNDIVSCERLETLGDSFLKFAVSLTLFETQFHLQEGHLTHIKGGIVGNKNLYFCGKKKGLGPMLGVDEFSPNNDWVAPGFHVPNSVQSVIRNANLNVNCLYSVEIPDNVRKSDVMAPGTRNFYTHALLENSEELLQPQNCSFTNSLALTDKNIADAVEAILGVYLKSSGILGALDLMNWFGVTDPDLSSRQVFTRKPASAAMGSGDPYIHLQQPHNLESILNYKFQDRSFLLQALSHPSYTRNNITKCYQRLEFLGDAIIDFLITIHIYEKCSTLTPGELTDLRSALVNNVTLACISVRNHFHKFLLYHSSVLNEFIARFVKNQEERNHVIDHDILFLVEEDEVNIAEAVDVPKALGDVFEALIGAIYLDSGKDLNVTWKIVYNLMKEEIESFSKDIPKNHIRMLYESGSLPEFTSHIQRNGVVLVTVEILHNGLPKQFNGFGDNKNDAKRAASKHALRYIRSLLQH